MRYQRLGRDDAPVICADLCSEGPSTSRDAHLCGDVELGLQHIGRTISKSLHSRSASLSIVGWAPGMPLAEMSRALVVQEGRFRCRCSVPSRPSPTSGKQSSSSCPACGGVVRRSRAGGSWGSGHWEAACCAAPDCSQPAQERKMAKARKVGECCVQLVPSLASCGSALPKQMHPVTPHAHHPYARACRDSQTSRSAYTPRRLASPAWLLPRGVRAVRRLWPQRHPAWVEQLDAGPAVRLPHLLLPLRPLLDRRHRLSAHPGRGGE